MLNLVMVLIVLGSSVEPCGGPDVTDLVVSALCITTRRPLQFCIAV